MPGRVFTWIIHYVVVELKNDHQTDECLTKKSSRTTNHRLKLTMCKVQSDKFTVLLDPFGKHIAVLCSPNFSTMKSSNWFKRDLPKLTLCMNSGWFDSSEASHKKAHWLVEGEMSSSSTSQYDTFYDSPQLYWTSQSSCKESIWAEPYYIISVSPSAGCTQCLPDMPVETWKTIHFLKSLIKGVVLQKSIFDLVCFPRISEHNYAFSWFFVILTM